MAGAMASVLVHYEFEEGDESLNLVRPLSSTTPPALPFPLTNKRSNDAWFATLPEATRIALERVARANAEPWHGGERVLGAVVTPIN